MNLVVGATGMLGSEICRRLVGEGEAVRGLVRGGDPGKRETLEAMGVGPVEGDLSDPASLREACRGAQTVISTATAMPVHSEEKSIETVDRRGQLNLVEAAREEGVERFVFISFPPMDLTFPLQTAKREVEAAIRDSGMEYTILQPTMFMEVWLSPHVGFDHPNRRVRIFGEGDQPISWISYEDVAAFAVRAATGAAGRNATVELGGPEALTALEVVGEFERVTGASFEREHVPVEALNAQRAAAPDPTQESMAALAMVAARGDAIPMEETAEAFGVELTPVRAYAERVVGGGA